MKPCEDLDLLRFRSLSLLSCRFLITLLTTKACLWVVFLRCDRECFCCLMSSAGFRGERERRSYSCDFLRSTKGELCDLYSLSRLNRFIPPNFCWLNSCTYSNFRGFSSDSWLWTLINLILLKLMSKPSVILILLLSSTLTSWDDARWVKYWLS